MSKSTPLTLKEILTNWKFLCGIIVSTASVLVVIWGVFYWAAGISQGQLRQDKQIVDNNEVTSKIFAKLDAVEKTTNEMDGKVQLLVDILIKPTSVTGTQPSNNTAVQPKQVDVTLTASKSK